MEPHIIQLPRIVLIGKGAVEKISDVCEKLNLIKNPLILVDLNTKKIVGDRIKDLLFDFNPKLEIVSEASPEEVKKLELIENVNFVLGVGGGKVIDVGKLLAFRKGVPFISVPTAPSHDGIVSSKVSLKSKGKLYSFKVETPTAIIADIEILINAPYKLIASGCGDVIAKYTSVYDWKLAKEKGEYYSEYAAELALLSAKIVSKSAKLIRNKKERGIRNLVQALISSGISMSLAGSSRPASGSEHMFSHALDSLGSNALHGEQCGVGTILMSYLQGQNWEKIRNLLKLVGAPTNAKELNVSNKMIIEALLKAKDVRKRYTILNINPLNKEKAIKISKETKVIE